MMLGSPVSDLNSKVTTSRHDTSILVVDDNDISQKLLRLYLVDLGYRVFICNDGYSALSILQTESIDLVFLDIHMPVMNGYEITRAIRQLDNKYRNLPIIGLSADGLPDSLQKAMETGMNEYLVKPIKQDDLKEIIARWLKNPRTGSARYETRDSSADSANQLHDLRQMLAKELPDYKTRLIRALQEINHREIYNVAHRIAGGSAYCDMPELNDLSQRLQMAAKRVNGELVDRYTGELIEHIDRILKEYPPH